MAKEFLRFFSSLSFSSRHCFRKLQTAHWAWVCQFFLTDRSLILKPFDLQRLSKKFIKMQIFCLFLNYQREAEKTHHLCIFLPLTLEQRQVKAFDNLNDFISR